MTSTRICRRTVLRGLGATVALPLLEAMLPSPVLGGGSAGQLPRRMAFIMFPLGAWMPYWMPSGKGPDYALTPCLEPLAGSRATGCRRSRGMMCSMRCMPATTMPPLAREFTLP